MTTRKNNSLALRAMEGEIVPEEQTYQAELRNAIYDGVSETDVAEVVKSIVEKAKKGDPQATRLFFDYVLGAKSKPTPIVVNNHFTDADQPHRLNRKREAS